MNRLFLKFSELGGESVPQVWWRIGRSPSCLSWLSFQSRWTAVSELTDWFASLEHVLYWKIFFGPKKDALTWRFNSEFYNSVKRPAIIVFCLPPWHMEIDIFSAKCQFQTSAHGVNKFFSTWELWLTEFANAWKSKLLEIWILPNARVIVNHERGCVVKFNSVVLFLGIFSITRHFFSEQFFAEKKRKK